MTPELVGAALQRAVPELRDGRLVLHSCTIRRLRLDDRQGTWHGTILLAVADGAAGGSQPPAVRVVPLHATVIVPGRAHEQGERGQGEADLPSPAYPFGDAEWRCFLPELCLALRTQQADAELAMLPQLTDVEAARVLLERAFVAATTPPTATWPSAPAARGWRVPQARQPLHDPLPARVRGRDAEQASAEGGPPHVVVAKTYYGDKGQNAYAGMQALWRSPLGHSSTVRIAEPLAWLPELNVLVQGPIRESLPSRSCCTGSCRPAGRRRQAVNRRSRLRLPATSARLLRGWRSCTGVV